MTTGERQFIHGALILFWVTVTLAVSVAIMEGLLVAMAAVSDYRASSPGEKLPPFGEMIWSRYDVGQAGAIFGALSFLGICACVNELRKEGKKVMPAFIWPKHSSETPSGVARFGRVCHWTFATLAALSIAFGIVYVVDNRIRAAEDRTELAEWQRTPHATEAYSYPPYVRPEDDTGFWVGLGFGAMFLLVGRGFRYVLSNE